MTLNYSFYLPILWRYSHNQIFLCLKDCTTFFAESQVTTCKETPRWEAVMLDERVKHRTSTQEDSVSMLVEIKVVVTVVISACFLKA